MCDHITLKNKFTHEIKKLLFKTYRIHHIYIFILVFKFRIIITKYDGK